MSEALWSLERKCSETVVGLELFVCLSTGLRCSLKRSLSRRFVSPMYCLFFHVLEASSGISPGNSGAKRQKTKTLRVF